MPDSNQKILLVDDDPDILELLTYNLEKEGFNVKSAQNGIKGVEKAKSYIPDLILMDIMMPQQDGVETCRHIRNIPELKNVYIIFLTARSEEYSEVAAFESGADDYITKPIKPRALISRIKALFRREVQKNKEQNQIEIDRLKIDKSSYTVTIDGEIINLPKKEFELLFYLAKNPGTVYSRDELLQSIWGTDVYVLARTVDVHIRKVREKIGEDYIVTIKGVGYKFQPRT